MPLIVNIITQFLMPHQPVQQEKKHNYGDMLLTMKNVCDIIFSYVNDFDEDSMPLRKVEASR